MSNEDRELIEAINRAKECAVMALDFDDRPPPCAIWLTWLSVGVGVGQLARRFSRILCDQSLIRPVRVNMLLHDELHKAAVDATLLLDAHVNELDSPYSIVEYLDFILPSRLRATAALGKFRYDLVRVDGYDQWYEALLYFAKKHGLGLHVRPSRESTPDGVFVEGSNAGLKVAYAYRLSW